MKPFILKQHQKDSARVRELRASEMTLINGRGNMKLHTMTVTGGGANNDDGDDGEA